MITLFDNETILRGYTREREKAALIEGLNRGRTEGRSEGMKEGQATEKMATVKKMLKKALPIDLIAELSGLTPAEINAIKAQMAVLSSVFRKFR